MISFEEAGAMLDEAVDALPAEIFEKLNGGVNLLPASKTDENGLIVMGMYFNDAMGRHVEIYYGSFCQTLAEEGAEKWKSELTHVLKHELTHHVEGLAGDRSLERWDETHKAELLAGLDYEPLEADSLLFFDADDSGLAPLAEALFRIAAKDDCPEIRSASAGLSSEPPACVNPNAAKAASDYGADITAHIPRQIDRALTESCDAILCMTEEQGDELAGIYPDMDHKILCLGDRDIGLPLLDTYAGWRRAATRVADEIEYLIDELVEQKSPPETKEEDQ